MRAYLLVAVLIIGIVAVPVLPQAHATSGTYFDNIVVIAMENRAFTEVIGNSNAPFINSMIPYSATLQHYNSYGAAGRSVSGCSAGCYVALTSGSDQGVSDGYGCCLSVTNVIDNIVGIGGSWQAYCESGCPRGNDHFPFTAYASISNSPNIFAGSSVSPTDLINAANSANPPTFLWYTPTDANNMHDGSVSAGDSYLQNFLVGSGSIQSPASGSLFSSSLFTSGKRVLFLLWWDECGNGAYGCDSNNSTPNVWYGPKTSIIAGYSSTSTAYDEYSILHLIENNWALPTLAANDAAAAPMTEIFGSSTPPPLTTSFTTSPSTPIVNLPVTFTATTTGGKSPYTISWNFGDGSTGTGASITHTYASAQSFTVTETATDSSSPSQTATSSTTVTIGTPPPLTTSFTFLPSNPIVNTPVTFTTTTSGGTSPYSIAWNFGDGTSGSGASITHTFTSAQAFTVIETATDSSSPSQTATSSKTVTIQPPPPLSTSFTFLPTNPTTNTPVSFTATTTGGTSPYTITWKFGDGTLGTGATTSHTYTTAQSFTVTENATDSSSPSKMVTISTTVIVSPPPPPSTSFTFLPSSPVVNSPVIFTSTTTGGISPYTVSWNFGDGTAATGLTATHTFSSAQTFTVTETATDSSIPAQTTTSSQSVNVITSSPLAATLTPSSSSLYARQTETFSASAAGGIVPYTYTIDFGDGSTGTGSSTSHAYSTAGTYTATLTVTDSASPQTSITATATVNVQSAILPALTIPQNQTVTAGTWINFTVTATDADPARTLTLSATQLPTGATFDTSTGQFSWKPSSTQTGYYTIHFTATDDNTPPASSTQPMGVQVAKAATSGSGGGSNGGSGGSSNGSCLLCGIFPAVSRNVWLLAIGGLLGMVASLALLTIKARASLEQTKRRMNRLTRED